MRLPGKPGTDLFIEGTGRTAHGSRLKGKNKKNSKRGQTPISMFLASDMADHITGQYIPVDGGGFMV